MQQDPVGYLQPSRNNECVYDSKDGDLRRHDSFMTAPDGGWLHNQFALQYGEGVFYSFPVTYLGRYPLRKSLRTVEFPVRNIIAHEAIARVREAARTRAPIQRNVDYVCRAFLDDFEPDIRMEDIVLNISVQGIVLATPNEENVLAHHRMTTISFAAGGEYEDYDQVAYVAKTRMGRMCYVFDCGAYSNQVLATIGQAFVSAGERLAEIEEAEEELDAEYQMYAEEFDGLTEREYQDLYGTAQAAARYEDVQDPSSPAYARYDQLNERERDDTSCYYHNTADGHDIKYDVDYSQYYSMPLEANSNYHEVSANAEYEMAENGHYSAADGIVEYNSNYHEVSVEPEGAYYTTPDEPISNNYHRVKPSSRHYSRARQSCTYEAASETDRIYDLTIDESDCAGANVSEANPDYHQVSTEDEVGGRTYNMAMKESDYSTAAQLRVRHRHLQDDRHYSMAADESELDLGNVSDEWARLAQVDANQATHDTGYIDENYIESMYEDDGTQKALPNNGYLAVGDDIYQQQSSSPGTGASPKQRSKAEPPQTLPKPDKKKRGLFGRKRKEAVNSPLTANSTSNKTETEKEEAEENVPMVEPIDYSKFKRTPTKQDEPYSEAYAPRYMRTGISKQEGPYSQAVQLSASGDGQDVHVAGKRPSETYSQVQKLPPPLLPRKTDKDLALQGSIRLKPLQGKGDFLVRKLNSKVLSATTTPATGIDMNQGGNLPDTPATRQEQNQQQRRSVPEWSYIPPERLATARDS